MRDKLEKYASMSDDFSNRAGEFNKQLITMQRLMHQVMKEKNSDQVKQLLLAGVNTCEVGADLLNYMHDFMKGVGLDARALIDGAEMRNTIQLQSEEIQMCWEKLRAAGLK